MSEGQASQAASNAPRRPQWRTQAGSARRRRLALERRADLLELLEELLLAEGFLKLTVDDLASRLQCSKATLYSLASSKEQLVVAVTKQFFRRATEEIERTVQEVDDPRRRISAYLAGVGSAMSRCSPVFYGDMVSFAPTASIYDVNSAAAARRVRELIAAGIEAGEVRAVNGALAGRLAALAIEGIQSGVLLGEGMAAGEAYLELADLLWEGLAVRRD